MSYGGAKNSVIFNNRSYNKGGGAYAGNMEGHMLINCVVSNNVAEGEGGGVHLYGSKIQNSTICHNKGSEGGGVYALGGTVWNCDIYGNEATATTSSSWSRGGGGVGGSNWNGGRSYGTFYNCDIHDNTAVRGGGVLFARLYKCNVHDNVANFGGGGYSLWAFDSLIVGNRAKRKGGGVYGGALYNCTVTKNTADDCGGGVYTSEENRKDDRFSVAAYNSIVYGNTAVTNAADGYLGYWYNSCVGYLQDDLETIKQSVIFKNPKFVDAAKGDYRLSADSPCVDKGDNGHVETETDYADKERIYNGTVDMGAYEYGAGAKKYTVTFALSSSSYFEALDETSREVEKGKAVGTLPNVTVIAEDYYYRGILNHCAFKGWFTKSNGGDLVTASTVITSDVTFYAQYEWIELQGITYTVMFNANGGTASETTRMVTSGAAIGTLPTATKANNDFVGWFTAASGGTQITASTKVSANVTYYAHWKASGYKNGDSVQVIIIIRNTPVNKTVIYGKAWGSDLPVADEMDGYTFVGWFTQPDGRGTKVTATTLVSAETLKLYAYYVKDELPSLYETITGTAPTTTASVYDGCLCDGAGNVAGTIQVKVAKPKGGTAKVTAAITPVGGRKVTEKGTLDLATGKVSGMDLTLGAYGMTGSFGGYEIDGARNVFSSRSADDKAIATLVYGKWPTVSVAWKGGALTVAIDKKGKAKITGTLASGVKVSSKSQVLVGEEWLCVPVIWVKRSETLAFTLWLQGAGVATYTAKTFGLGNGVKVGGPKALKGGASFCVDAASVCALLGDDTYAKYLPDGVSVAQSGTRWVVAGGEKAGKVQLARDGKVDEAKTGANPSGLKLTYKAKDGTFKGSFKAYASVNGRLKASTFTVVGVMVGDKGYGLSILKSKGSVQMSIE